MLESKIKFKSKPVTYIPALGFSALTPFFDLLQKWGAKESTFKPKLIEHAKIHDNFKVLDLGCGTATLTILVKKNYPSTEVSAIDIDTEVLTIAREKAVEAKVKIAFDLGAAFNLPYPNNHFDRILSSLVFHHLTRENKIRTLREAYRVLKPNGELHVADLGKPQNALMRMPSLIMGHLEETEDNVKGLLPRMFRIAGFEQVEENAKIMTIFGTVALYEGRKPPIFA